MAKSRAPAPAMIRFRLSLSSSSQTRKTCYSPIPLPCRLHSFWSGEGLTKHMQKHVGGMVGLCSIAGAGVINGHAHHRQRLVHAQVVFGEDQGQVEILHPLVVHVFGVVPAMEDAILHGWVKDDEGGDDDDQGHEVLRIIFSLPAFFFYISVLCHVIPVLPKICKWSCNRMFHRVRGWLKGIPAGWERRGNAVFRGRSHGAGYIRCHPFP